MAMNSSELARVMVELQRVGRKMLTVNPQPTLKGLRAWYREWLNACALVDTSTLRVAQNVTIRAVAPFQDLHCEWVYASDSDPQKRLLYLHGGGWFGNSLQYHRPLAARIGAATGCAVLLMDFREIPQHRYPAALADSIAGFLWMLAQGTDRATPARETYIAGDSTGGNLALAVLLALRDRGLHLPDACVTLSPVTDCANLMSRETVAEQDDPAGIRALITHCTNIYAGCRSNYNNPYLSPVGADLKGLPPILIQVGGGDPLLNECHRFACKARRDGIVVRLEEWTNQPHTFHRFAPFLPEARQAISQIGDFMQTVARSK